ncbi:MAG: hypothetical protein HQK87_06530, partial [Nitrospinae bacterium]|nr:hypothetical protein [Nitrospinota bacterium]
MADERDQDAHPTTSEGTGHTLADTVADARRERKVLSDLVNYLERNKEEIDRRASLFKDIGERIESLDTVSGALKGRLDETRAAEQEITETSRKAAELAEEVDRRKKDLDAVNRLVEHINSKIKGLSLQRVIVERANEEAGKLNVLFWDMESRIKRLTEENKLVRKAEKNLVRLESMLERIADRMGA